MARPPTDDDYRRLLGFRSGLRRFLHWSEERAKEQGLTAMQHQLLLAIRGHDDERGPTISDAAGYLLLRHHSTVELAHRTADAGLLTRVTDPSDHRVVRLRLTPKGARKLEALATSTLAELDRFFPAMRRLWAGLS